MSSPPIPNHPHEHHVQGREVLGEGLELRAFPVRQGAKRGHYESDQSSKVVYVSIDQSK
jgi:hypothetical protein